MSVDSLPKVYEPKSVEGKLTRWWLEKNYFQPKLETSDSKLKVSKGPFCIVIPPPNITGSLHIGHALDLTIQDVLTRWKRMQGYDALWLPGTDHAGIATQNVVEKGLAENGISRHELGREEFERRVWKWKEDAHGQITDQLRRLGASCDWSRERFTLDEGCSRAVRYAFTNLYREGLIYRGERMINWCPRCATALSDIEVEHKQIAGKLYYLRYPLEEIAANKPQTISYKADYLVVATTRPETMLGDTAVAANPTDTRHSSLAGRKAILPLVNRELPIILDDKVEPDFGTGLVKITPAHDPDDFEIGQKHGLARLVVIGPEGKMNENAGPYADLDRYEARERILQDLKEQDLLEKVEEHLHAVGHCQRCNTPVEPVVSLQWFVKMEPLAKLGMEAVTSGKVRFIPQRWEKVYLDWLANIRDWCISRQLWWGHRIPVWYCRECGEENVENETPLNCHRCGSKELVQDEDVLDTWFSSALWPFSTLGWPEKTEDFAYFYPTSVLVTGYDIIYFWVARMIMMGMKFTGGEPFRKVWIHGLVRDAKGRKMSKSEGNVVDPLETVERFSADSLRYALASACALGQDFRLTEERLVGARNFCNKIWNAARFVLQASPPPANYKPEALNPKKARLADRWIMSLLQKAVARVTKALEEYRLDEACQAAHEFFWDNFCDWYIETSKLSLGGLPNEHGEAGKGDAPATNHNSPAPEANDTIWVLRHCLRTTMRLLHPIMPFISEEVWQRLNESGTGRFTEDEASNLKAQGPKLHAQSICIAPWPEVEEEWIDEEAEELMSSIMWIEQGIRDRCAALLLSPQEEAEVAINLSSAIPSLPKREILAQTLESRDIQELIKKLSGPWSIENIKVFRKQEDAGNWLSTTSRWAGSLPLGTTQSPSGIVLTVLPKGEVDLKSRLQPELERLRKELTLAEAELARSLVKISNPDFLSRARPEAVEKERKKEMEFRQKVESVQQRVKQIEKVMNNSTLATESRRD